jgi:hypothetical protein
LIALLFQRNHYLFLPWIILGLLLCIGLLVDVIYTAVVFFLDSHNKAGTLWLVFGLLAVGKSTKTLLFVATKLRKFKTLCLFVVIYFYMWAVVLSHFMQLKEQNDRGRYSRTPYRR